MATVNYDNRTGQLGTATPTSQQSKLTGQQPDPGRLNPGTKIKENINNVNSQAKKTVLHLELSDAKQV